MKIRHSLRHFGSRGLLNRLLYRSALIHLRRLLASIPRFIVSFEVYPIMFPTLGPRRFFIYWFLYHYSIEERMSYMLSGFNLPMYAQRGVQGK